MRSRYSLLPTIGIIDMTTKQEMLTLMKEFKSNENNLQTEKTETRQLLFGITLYSNIKHLITHQSPRNYPKLVSFFLQNNYLIHSKQKKLFCDNRYIFTFFFFIKIIRVCSRYISLSNTFPRRI